MWQGKEGASPIVNCDKDSHNCYNIQTVHKDGRRVHQVSECEKGKKKKESAALALARARASRRGAHAHAPTSSPFAGQKQRTPTSPSMRLRSFFIFTAVPCTSSTASGLQPCTRRRIATESAWSESGTLSTSQRTSIRGASGGAPGNAMRRDPVCSCCPIDPAP